MKKLELAPEGSYNIIAGVFPDYEFKEIVQIITEKVEEHYSKVLLSIIPAVVQSELLVRATKSTTKLDVEPKQGELTLQIIKDLQDGIKRELSYAEFLEIGMVIGARAGKESVLLKKLSEGAKEMAKLCLDLGMPQATVVTTLTGAIKNAKEMFKAGKKPTQTNASQRVEDLLRELFK